MARTRKFSSFNFFSCPTSQLPPYNQQQFSTSPRCCKSALTPVFLCLVQTAKIQFLQADTILPTPSLLDFENVDLDQSILPDSFISSFPINTVNISAQDFLVFATASNQQTWLPSSSSCLPAVSAQQHQLQHLELPSHQQDFVLFEQSPRPHRQHSRSVSHPSGRRGVTNQQKQQKQRQVFQQSVSGSPSLHNQRVANIIQATGHQTSPVFNNRFSSLARNAQQFYASSAPSSSVSLDLQNEPHLARPPVPLFSQSIGNTAQGQAVTDMDLDEFTAFEGGASTSYASPAIPAVFDMNGSVSSSTTNMGTVSPQELLLAEPYMSAPNSAALTNVTSPSAYNGSPDFNSEGFDVSPNFVGSDYEAAAGDVWFPLFPQDPVQQPSSLEQSPEEQSDDLEVVERPTHSRKKSGSSPPSGRHSSVSGVNSRRRDKPLPPIIIEDPTDTVAMKRARNTLAARKSRERKAQRFEELEEKIQKLEAERDHWKKLALASGAK